MASLLKAATSGLSNIRRKVSKAQPEKANRTPSNLDGAKKADARKLPPAESFTDSATGTKEGGNGSHGGHAAGKGAGAQADEQSFTEQKEPATPEALDLQLCRLLEGRDVADELAKSRPKGERSSKVQDFQVH